MNKLKEILTGHSSHSAEEDETTGEGSHLRSTHPHQDTSTSLGSSAAGAAGYGSGPGSFPEGGQQALNPPDGASTGTGTGSGATGTSEFGRSNDPYSQSGTTRSSDLARSTDPYSQTAGSGSGRSNDPYSQTGTTGNSASGLTASSGLGSSTNNPSSASTSRNAVGGDYASGITSAELASGISSRPRPADKNASTISIKSGVMGHDDASMSYGASTIDRAYPADTMKPLPDTPSTAYSATGGGITGSSLPDRSIGPSASSAAPQSTTASSVAASAADARMFTHGQHITDTANRLDPREPDASEGLLPPSDFVADGSASGFSSANPSASYGGATTGSSTTAASSANPSGSYGATTTGTSATSTKVSQPYATDPITTEPLGSSAVGSTDGYGSRDAGNTSSSAFRSAERDPTSYTSTGSQQYGRDAAAIGGAAAVAGGVAGTSRFDEGDSTSSYSSGKAGGVSGSTARSDERNPTSTTSTGDQSSGRDAAVGGNAGSAAGGLEQEYRKHEAQKETHRVGEGLQGVPASQQAELIRQRYEEERSRNDAPTDERGHHLGGESAVASGVSAGGSDKHGRGATDQYSDPVERDTGSQGYGRDAATLPGVGAVGVGLSQAPDLQGHGTSDRFTSGHMFGPDRTTGGVGAAGAGPVNDSTTSGTSGFAKHEEGARGGLSGLLHRDNPNKLHKDPPSGQQTTGQSMMAHQTFEQPSTYEHQHHMGTDGPISGRESGNVTGSNTGHGLATNIEDRERREYGASTDASAGTSGQGAEASWEAIQKANTPY